MTYEKKTHWEHIYATRKPHEVGWTQAVPATSLALIHALNLPKSAHIIDIGGGDSTLVDFLLQEGYTNITVLDISSGALDRAKERLGPAAQNVHWIVSDILAFQPERQYDLWHDRAAFHFLITDEQVEQYARIAAQSVQKNIIMATFSKNGPKKCSGLDIHQYSETDLAQVFEKSFKRVKCLTEDHFTPGGVAQNYTFCCLERSNT